MRHKTILFLYAALVTFILILVVFTVNQLSAAASLLSLLHPFAGTLFLLFSAACILFALYSGFKLFAAPKKAVLPKNGNSKKMIAYTEFLLSRLPVHPMHQEPLTKKKDQKWVRTNLRFIEVDANNTIKQIATKNFFVGAFAQNTSYGTTTSLMNILKVVWKIYVMHTREQQLREFISLIRSVYGCLPLSDFKKEDIPAHIRPIIQSSFSNTLSTLLPAGNLLSPFFLNLFIAGSTNTYLTCLAGIIATRHCQIMTEEDKKEIIQQSMFEASFMLKEIVRECNPILSVTISQAVKKAGIESLDTIHPPSTGSGMAQDIVSHLASSLKNMLKDNG
ncbi:hypothetical protein [Pelodictyon phaeoclathratiforme]|uniref:DUF697 domain-containing protein n=1 Tax=Pelodictyon phaeoclathratiforme (strain DSM 5477 / BU-1) TaxID=324925 RepID=B4SEH8_PELPB|nr:hypothetical protein [Pelodictyon phaeoclathratiforme]ACF43070.1 conserved hypothetical protein [Pelodictyon phaeoclathratiforme BU-1]